MLNIANLKELSKGIILPMLHKTINYSKQEMFRKA